MAGFVSFALIMLAIGAGTSKKVNFLNCPSQKLLGEILSVDIIPCDDDPCVFKPGGNESLTLRFIPREVVQSGMIYVYAVRWGKSFLLPLRNRDVCKGYGLTCPLKSGNPVQLTITEEVPQQSPSGSYLLEVLLLDQNHNIVVCGIVDFKIA